jgi:AcrR family transcriptional regulator
MQTKKEAMIENLLICASAEFLEKGFEKASIRKIVKSANTTIGNFYNYFDSKEQIFSALVDDVYHGFLSMISTHNDSGFSIDIANLENDALRSALLDLLGQIMPHVNDRFLLLVAKSQGTKYSGVKTELIAVMTEHFYEHIREYNPLYRHKAMGRIIATQLLSGIIEILSTVKDQTQQKTLISEQMVFVICGMMQLLK